MFAGGTQGAGKVRGCPQGKEKRAISWKDFGIPADLILKVKKRKGITGENLSGYGALKNMAFQACACSQTRTSRDHQR